ncbi:MAG: DUF58 domain-containing protein [Clostridia bacterium]|nr:DUF58 domain-containing protein [Clostridia bacterium]MBQ2949261.1 DUF58 domain-containing protein [Clostridia bacterium]
MLLFGLALSLTALSVSSPGAFLLGAAAIIALALSLISVVLAALSCRISQRIDVPTVSRGGLCRYTIRARMFAPLPIAPLQLSVLLPSGKRSEFLLPARLLGATESDNDFPCPHVGVYPVGAESIVISDCFGLFSLRRRLRQLPAALTVLPVPRKTRPVQYSPGEGETGASQRAQADRTTPEDTRLWQEGDELGRVHWKLSMRRQQLMVHTYETPQRPDALVIMDCAAPQTPDSRRAAVIDALTETCAGVLKSLLDQSRITRLPLSGDAPQELSGSRPEQLAPMLQALAQERFVKTPDFARVLLLSARRMRRTGSTVILTTHLTPGAAEAAIALSRTGPHTRLTLVTAGEMTTEEQQLMHLLFSSGVETSHVRV